MSSSTNSFINVALFRWVGIQVDCYNRFPIMCVYRKLIFRTPFILKTIPVLMLIFLKISLFAQTDFSKYQHKHLFCKPWIGNNIFLEKYLASINYDNDSTPLYCVPIKVWAYGGDNLPTDTQIAHLINNINSIFRANNTKIVFYLSDVERFQKKRFQRFGFYTNAFIQSCLHHQRGVVNIVLAGWLSKHSKKKRNLIYMGYFNHLTNTIVTIPTGSRSVAAHEMGHYLGLRHTHRFYKRGKHRQESVDTLVFRRGLFIRGRNVEINGDGLSDTKAQPYLRNLTDFDCKYMGNQHITDRWKNCYTPQTNNVMSYTQNKDCRTQFTRMQRAVMLYTLKKNRFSKRWEIDFSGNNNGFASYPDSYEPDFSPFCANQLPLGSCQHHTFNAPLNGKVKQGVDSDWFEFSSDVFANNYDSFKITIEPGIIDFGGIKAVLFTNNLQVIDTFSIKNIDDRIELDLSNYPKGKYYLKTEPLVFSKALLPTDYFISFTAVNIKPQINSILDYFNELDLIETDF